MLDALARLAPGGTDTLADLLSLREVRRFEHGLRVVVTTDLALWELTADDIRPTKCRFVVLEARAFGSGSRNDPSGHLPVVPWLLIDGPARVASCLRRAGKEVAVGG